MPRVLAFLLLLAPALAQSALAPLRDHPLARQAQSYLEAARKALLAQESPVALNLQAGHTRLGYACTPEALCQSLPSSGSNLTLALVLTPFPFGDVADGQERARIALRRAELGYRRALTALQVQAVAAYGRYQEALLGEKLALKGVELAQMALEAARKRQANPKELREAELALKEAENRLEEARRGVALAEQAALGLVDLRAPLPQIPLPQGGAYLQVEEARLSVQEAQIAYDGAFRNLLPKLDVSYLRYPSGNDTLALSLSSRTLQPTLSYTRQDPARPATQVPGAGSYRSVEELRLSLSLTLSPGLFQGLAAAEAQLQGALEALKAAEAQARLQEETLKSALQSAEAALALAQLRLEGEQKALEEVKRRLELGLESGLALKRAELSLLQAELARLQAENNLKNRLMELYQLYGQILEVNP